MLVVRLVPLGVHLGTSVPYFRGCSVGKDFLPQDQGLDKDRSKEFYVLNYLRKSEDYLLARSLKSRSTPGETGDRLQFANNYTPKQSRTREEENVESNRQHCLRNKDNRRDYQRQYKSRNRTVILAHDMQYRSRNVEKIEYESQQQYRLRTAGKQQFHRAFSRFGDAPTATTPHISWKSPELVRDYFDSIAKDLHIKNFADWYRISRHQIDAFQGKSLYNKFGSLGAALQYAYPEIEWDLRLFSMSGRKKSVQRWLKVKVRELLAGTEIIEDYLHPDLQCDDSDRKMELDLWIPQHRIGVEYQGEQHYHNLENAFGTTRVYGDRDLAKHDLCEKYGITLIAIPFWWDGSIESLSATLYRLRPDVFPVCASNPIPLENPAQFHDRKIPQAIYASPNE